MNLMAMAPTWLLVLLYLLLAGAAIDDAWRLRIANWFPIGIMVGAIVAAAIAGPTMMLWQNLALFAGLLVLGTFLFGAGLLGGGDVKLFAACGLWFDGATGWRMLVATALAGGVLAIFLLSIRPLVPDAISRRLIVLRPKGGIPYGVAIAAGTAAVGLLR